MTTVTILFEFSDDTSEECEFDVEQGVVAEIEEKAAELAEKRDADYSPDDGDDDEVLCDNWEVCCTDTDHADMATAGDFDDLDDYAEYVGKCEDDGEGFILRYADIGDLECIENYEGCWEDDETFAQHLVETCYDLKFPTFLYIDWERTARDVMMDYSTYPGSEGLHVFRD